MPNKRLLQTADRSPRLLSRSVIFSEKRRFIRDSFDTIYNIQIQNVLSGRDTFFPFSLIHKGLPLGNFKMYYYWTLNFVEVGICLPTSIKIYKKLKR